MKNSRIGLTAFEGCETSGLGRAKPPRNKCFELLVEHFVVLYSNDRPAID